MPETSFNYVEVGAGPSFGLGTRTGAMRQRRLLSLPVFKNLGNWTGSQLHGPAGLEDKHRGPLPGCVTPPLLTLPIEENLSTPEINGNPTTFFL